MRLSCWPFFRPLFFLYLLGSCGVRRAGYTDAGCLEMMRMYQTIHTDHEVRE